MEVDERLLNAFKALVQDSIPNYRLFAPVRYRVVSTDTGVGIPPEATRVKLQAISEGLGYPDVLPVVMFPGVAGAFATLTPGAIVLVSFIEGNPQMPVITHFAEKDDLGWRPVSVVLDATATVSIGPGAIPGSPLPLIYLGSTGPSLTAKFVARQGSTVGAGPFKGFITGGTMKVFADGVEFIPP